jgi:hypothetical protein
MGLVLFPVITNFPFFDSSSKNHYQWLRPTVKNILPAINGTTLFNKAFAASVALLANTELIPPTI